MKFPSYPKYKESGVEWLGHVPEHWEVRRFKFLLRDVDGNKIGPFGSALRLEDMEDEGIKVYGQENIINNDFTVGYRRISPGKYKEMLVYTALPGDILITMMGTSGRCQIVPEEVETGIIDSHLLRLRIDDVIFNKYIQILIDRSYTIKSQIDHMGRGSIMQGLNSGIVKELIIPLPPLPEQHAIAAFLDAQTAKLDTLIAKKRALIAKLKEKRAALITRTVTRGLPPEAAKAAGLDPNPRMKDSGVEWLGEVPEHWEVKPLGYLVRMAGGGTPDKSKAEFWDGDIPWVSPKDMKKPHLFDAEDHITEEAIQNSPVMMLPLNSILIVVRGMILAHSFPVALSKVPLTINQDMKALICLKNILPEFLLFVVSGFTRIFVAFADESAHGTRKIETDIIRRLPIPVPSCDEQRAIISHLEREIMKCDTLITKIESAIAKLQEYRAALITAAVTGKIDVHQNWR